MILFVWPKFWEESSVYSRLALNSAFCVSAAWVLGLPECAIVLGSNIPFHVLLSIVLDLYPLLIYLKTILTLFWRKLICWCKILTIIKLDGWSSLLYFKNLWDNISLLDFLEAGAALMSMDHVTTEGQMEFCRLCCHLKPSWCQWPVLPLSAMRVTVVCVVAKGHIDVCGLSCSQRPGWGPRSMVIYCVP